MSQFDSPSGSQGILIPIDPPHSYDNAIEDDEEGEWENYESSTDDTITFERVPSKASLTPKRSLIGQMFAEQMEGTNGPSNYASRSAPAIYQSAYQLHNASKVTSIDNLTDTGLEMRGNLRRTPPKPINVSPSSGAQPIAIYPENLDIYSHILSPRTTRRNMLDTELTYSLRRQLLWERKQKNLTATAFLKRRHTSNDVADLKQTAEKAYTNCNDPNDVIWKQCDSNCFNARGW